MKAQWYYFFLLLLCSIGIIIIEWCSTSDPNFTITNNTISWSVKSDENIVNTTTLRNIIPFLKSISWEEIKKYKTVAFPLWITTPIQWYIIKWQDFANLWYKENIMWEEQYEFYVFMQDNKIIAILQFTDTWKFWNKNNQGYNDFYLLQQTNNEQTINNKVINEQSTILYKNFQPIVSGNNNHRIIDYAINNKNNIYTLRQTFQGDVISYSIQKNNEQPKPVKNINSRYIHIAGFDDDGEIIYWKSTDQNEWYSDTKYSLVDSQNHTIDSRTWNFLVSAETYTIIPYTGWFVIWREYQEWPNDIKESRKTITDKILNRVSEQEKTILKRYRLINQKNYQEAYNLLSNTTLSFEEFKALWNNYNLISVESIANPLVIFDTYWTLPQNVKTSDYNIFAPQLFSRTTKGFISYLHPKLQITSDNHIILLETSNNRETLADITTEKEKTTKLYYHLIANQMFDEAYNMQYTHNQSFEQFKNSYKNTLWIAIKETSSNNCDKNWCSSSNPDAPNGQVQILIDFIEAQNITRYYIQKEIINGKIKHISSEETKDACKMWCAYGYKPIIYLYPTEKTDINVYLPLQGEFTVTYPSISKANTWNITAQPDGTLINKEDQKEYSYLFREGKMKQPWKIQEWFVVKNEDTVAFLQEKLAYLWLKPKEYNEFIVYRRPLMMKNKYNIISFLGDQYTSQAPLIISPKPDSMQRVFMVFQWSDTPISLPIQKLEPWQRKWFAVVERGGAEL